MVRKIRDFQLPLFGGVIPNQIVNVASIPQRSPFRYPGGKTWLVPIIRQWLLSLPKRPKEFIEPFAGGAIVGLNVAFDQLAEHVTIVELDDQVAAVWHTIFQGDYSWLANKIITFDLTPENVEEILSLSGPSISIEEKAFQTIVKNRVNRGGILAPGAGKIKNGENGKGLKSRWYPETLKKRIIDLAKIRDRITFIEGDGLELMKEHINRLDVAYFIDPPYTASGKKAGTRLYKYFDIDHNELFDTAKSLSGDFLMTYDNSDGVKQLANQYKFKIEMVSMKNTHHSEMTELLIGRNIDWLYKK